MIEDYDGYESYHYLKPGADYEEVEAVESIHTGERYEIPLSAEQEERFERLAHNAVTIAPHEHPKRLAKDPHDAFALKRSGRVPTHFAGLAASHLDAMFDGMGGGHEIVVSKNGWKWDDVVYNVSMRRCDWAQSGHVILGDNLDDITRAREEGKIAIFPAIEGATHIENELDRLDRMYGMGVRMLGLTYNESNQIATGSNESPDAGLTNFGVEVVERMNDLGMAIGMSHESDQTMLDVCEISDQPVFLSHTGARQLWDSKRCHPDEVLEAVADTGGIACVEAAPNSTRTATREGHSIESVMEHFQYIEELVGIDHVSFAADTNYGDHVGLMRTFLEEDTETMTVFASTDEADESESKADEVAGRLTDFDYVRGMENPTESWDNIPRWMITEGYSDEDIRKVLAENTLRALSEIFPD